MHFEILIEDRSGKEALELLIPSLISSDHTHKIISYRGIGHLPQNLNTSLDPSKRALLNQLPRLLQGYGNAFSKYPSGYKAAVIFVCDLDDRCRREFRRELLNVLDQCNPRPEAYFCIAEEEGEAWFLGDKPAISSAYPVLRQNALNHYVPDSICGTWETLADAIYPGGAKSLSNKPFNEIGTVKCEWANRIPPHMNVDVNASPSFVYFRDKIRSIASTTE